MTKQLWCGLALSLLCALSACSEVDNCTVGEAGCVNGPPKDGKCLFDLKLVNGKCAEPGSSGDGSGDGTADGSTGDDAGVGCTCSGEGELCAATDGDTCVGWCEVPDRLPGSEADTKPEPIKCFKEGSEPDLTFAEVCVRTCKLRCQRQQWFCETAECDCTLGEGLLRACNDAIKDTPGCEDGDVTCLQNACDAIRSSGCSQDLKCPSGGSPDCAGVRCSNDCGDLNYDGWCDDGDTFNTSDAQGSMDSSLCTWGTDCADCGPRRGDDVPENLPIGAQCHFNARCAGHQITTVNGKNVVNLMTNESWCARLTEPVDGNFRCVPDASGKDEKCPEGYKTVQLAIGGTIQEMNGLKPTVCIPPDNFCQ